MNPLLNHTVCQHNHKHILQMYSKPTVVAASDLRHVYCVVLISGVWHMVQYCAVCKQELQGLLELFMVMLFFLLLADDLQRYVLPLSSVTILFIINFLLFVLFSVLLIHCYWHVQLLQIVSTADASNFAQTTCIWKNEDASQAPKHLILLTVYQMWYEDVMGSIAGFFFYNW